MNSVSHKGLLMFGVKHSHRLVAIMVAVGCSWQTVVAQPKERQVPPSPIPPTASLEWLNVDPNYQVELVAAEPEVIDPVAIQFDDRGRIWVTEMRDYPNGPNEGEAPKSRIRILEDKNNDGLFETSTVFADTLLFANGLQPFRDGVLATVSGKLMFFRDANGDGQVDATEPWIHGLAEQNPQLRANDPTIALDLNLYVANGLRSQSLETNPTGPLEKTSLDIRNRDLRINLRTHKLTTITGPSQFGMTWDRFGNRYFCSNRNPCDAVLVEQEQSNLSPLAGLAPLTKPVVPSGESSKVHPLTEAWTTSNLHAGQFSAACGVLVSAALSTDLSGESLGSSFTCEPTGNLVHRRSLARRDGKSVVDDQEPSQEFLASYDPWFRPVNIVEGPDGSLYVVDMYRAVIEHPQFMPEELKQRPDLTLGNDRGRIYRIRQRSAKASDGQRSLAVFDDLRNKPMHLRSQEELTQLLESPYEWWRSNAARILATEMTLTPNLRDALKTMSRSSKRVESRLRAAYLLQFWNVVESEDLRAWLESDELQMRIAARRILAQTPSDPSMQSLLVRQFDDALRSQSREETIAACWTLAQHIDHPNLTFSESFLRELPQRCGDLCLRDSQDAYLWMAASATCRTQLAAFSQHVTTQAFALSDQSSDDASLVNWLNSPWPQVLERLIQTTAKPDDSTWRKNVDDIIHTTTQAVQPSSIQPLRAAILTSLILGWAKSNDAAYLKVQDRLWSALATYANEKSTPSSIRPLIASTLAYAPSANVLPSLRQLVETADVAPALFSAAVKAWSKHPDPFLETWLIDQFKVSTGPRRDAIFAAILAHPKRTERLVEALEAKTIVLRTLSPSQLQSLKNVRVAALMPRIEAIYAHAIDANREKIVKQYQECLNLKPDLERGREVFQRQCSACHKIDTLGTNVGPDISDSRKYTPEQLLTSILDPNRAIDNNFFRFVVLTKEGEVCEGILSEETGTTVTLRGQNNKLQVLERAQIESIKSSGVSMMPEGLEAQIPPQAMADVIHFVKSWRYAGGKVPATNLE